MIWVRDAPSHSSCTNWGLTAMVVSPFLLETFQIETVCGLTESQRPHPHYLVFFVRLRIPSLCLRLEMQDGTDVSSTSDETYEAILFPMVDSSCCTLLVRLALWRPDWLQSPFRETIIVPEHPLLRLTSGKASPLCRFTALGSIGYLCRRKLDPTLVTSGCCEGREEG